MTLNDAIDRSYDLEKVARTISADIETATSCEKVEDFRANISEALTAAEELVKKLKKLKFANLKTDEE